jgi:hypothetical protein
MYNYNNEREKKTVADERHHYDDDIKKTLAYLNVSLRLTTCPLGWSGQKSKCEFPHDQGFHGKDCLLQQHRSDGCFEGPE